MDLKRVIGHYMRMLGWVLLVLSASPPVAIGLESLRFVIPEGWPAPPADTLMLTFGYWLLVTVAVVGFFIRELLTTRRLGHVAAFFGACVLLLGTLQVGWRLDRAAKRHGLAQVAANSRPLIRAIKQFESDRGAYPEALTALVPKHLRMVPSTGLAAFPKYGYERTADEKGEMMFDLWVDTPQGVLDFDSMHYLNDPERPDGDYSEVIGDWGFFDD